MCKEEIEKFDYFKANPEKAVREYALENDEFRTNFQRDRDRILYSKSFRRLSGKTQVFVAGYDDHMRTRLTHTLEVSQIAKTISFALGLDIDLTEAIALGHDLGHTPFGHVGERALSYILNGCDKIKDIVLENSKRGFKHNLQGVRVVKNLESVSKEYEGLNLTKECIWGIQNHTSVIYKECDNFKNDKCHLLKKNAECDKERELKVSFYDDILIDEQYFTFEALVVRMADDIAQRHHDIEDGIIAGLISMDELGKKLLDIDINPAEIKQIKLLEKSGQKYLLPALSKCIVNNLTIKIIENSKIALKKVKECCEEGKDFEYNRKNILKKYPLKKIENSKTHYPLFDIINYDDSFKEKEKKLQDFLKNRILFSHVAQRMDGKANYIIRCLAKAYVTNPQQMPDNLIWLLFKTMEKNKEIEAGNIPFAEIVGKMRVELNKLPNGLDSKKYNQILLRVACDYIAGMTDNYALKQYEMLYGSEILID